MNHNETEYMRFLELLRRLYMRTSEGAADWAESSRPDSFLYSSRAVSVVIQSRDGDGSPPFEAILLDSSGGEVLHWVTDFREQTPMEDSYLEVLNDLFKLVRQKSSRASQALDALERDLDLPF
jgi:hypothetical protein